MAKYTGNSYRISYEYSTATSTTPLKGTDVVIVAGSLNGATAFAASPEGQATFNPPVPASATVVENIVASRVESYENSVAIDTSLCADNHANLWKVTYDVSKATGIQRGYFLVCANGVEKATALAQECLGLATTTTSGTSTGVPTIWAPIFNSVAYPPVSGDVVTIWSVVRTTNVRWDVGVGNVTIITALTLVDAAGHNSGDPYTLTDYASAVLAGNLAPFTLIATPTPASGATWPGLLWASGNTAVVTVNSAGIIQPIAAGTTNITAKTTDGGNITATLSVEITA